MTFGRGGGCIRANNVVWQFLVQFKDFFELADAFWVKINNDEKIYFVSRNLVC